MGRFILFRAERDIVFIYETTLNDFASEGIIPDMVQVGNEISSGILHEDGEIGTDEDFSGLSSYPMWHGTMEGLQYNLNYLATTYDKDVCVVETAYTWT